MALISKECEFRGRERIKPTQTTVWHTAVPAIKGQFSLGRKT
jgi:hypothetical protein